MQSPFKTPEFSVDVAESIVHFLAYNNYTDQVKSMVSLMSQHHVSVTRDPSLRFRVALCTIFESLNQTNSYGALAMVLREIDDILAETRGLGLWGEFRLSFVVQMAVTLLRDKAGIKGDVITPQGVASLNPRQWKKEVKQLFEDEGYILDSGDMQEMSDLEVTKEFESLTDVGTPTDRVHVAYILKKYPWNDFINKVSYLFREVQDEVCGVPELLAIQQSESSESGGQAMAAIQEEDAQDEVFREPINEGPSDMGNSDSDLGDNRRNGDSGSDKRSDKDKRATSRSKSSRDSSNGKNAKSASSRVSTHLSQVANKLNESTNQDVLGNALADFSPMVRSVLAIKEGKEGGSKIESFVGKRGSSKTITFDSQDSTDSDDTLSEVPSLPKNGVLPIDLPARTARPRPSATEPSRASGSQKRKRMPWRSEEEAWIAEGVTKYGAGSWAEIKTEYFPLDSSRTSVNIKDKYRNMCKD